MLSSLLLLQWAPCHTRSRKGHLTPNASIKLHKTALLTSKSSDSSKLNQLYLPCKKMVYLLLALFSSLPASAKSSLQRPLRPEPGGRSLGFFSLFLWSEMKPWGAERGSLAPTSIRFLPPPCPKGGEGTSKSISLEGGLESELQLGCRRNTIPGEIFSQEKSYFAVRALISSCLLMMTLTKRDDMLPGKQGCFERKKSFRIKLGDGIYLHYGRPKPMFSRCILCLPLFLSPPSYANKI